MKAESERKRPVTVSLHPRIIKFIDGLAKSCNVSRSWAIGALIEEGLLAIGGEEATNERT